MRRTLAEQPDVHTAAQDWSVAALAEPDLLVEVEAIAVTA